MDANETLDLQQKVARLQALLEVSRRIHATIQLDEVLRVALEIVVRELEMDGAYFTTFPFSEGRIPPHVLLNPNGFEVGGGNFRFPLATQASKVLTELVVIPREGLPLTLEESDFIERLTLQIAIAIENARNHERIVRLQRVEQDLASARVIQRSLLPSSVQAATGYDMAIRSVSSYEVGGDYLDLLRLSSGEQIMIVADVAGKGLTSALIASSFRAAIRAIIMAGVPLVEVARQLNALLYAEGAGVKALLCDGGTVSSRPPSQRTRGRECGSQYGLAMARVRRWSGVAGVQRNSDWIAALRSVC